MADAYTMQRNFTDIGDFLQLSVELDQKFLHFLQNTAIYRCTIVN